MAGQFVINKRNIESIDRLQPQQRAYAVLRPLSKIVKVKKKLFRRIG